MSLVGHLEQSQYGTPTLSLKALFEPPAVLKGEIPVADAIKSLLLGDL